MDLSTIKAGDELHLTERFLSEGGWSNSWKYHRSSSKKQREIWAHGNELLLKTNPSQQDLAAALIQFQRAVELRDKLLDKLYGFEKIPGRPNPGKYAIMSDPGIIRPTLKIRLRELRNKLIRRDVVTRRHNVIGGHGHEASFFDTGEDPLAIEWQQIEW